MSSTHDPIAISQLGDDLLSLVGSVGVPLAEATPLHGAGYPGYEPNAFRLRFADGRILKGRRFGSAARAEMVEYVLRHLDHPAVPRSVGRSGEALLVEWAMGRPLDGVDCTPELLSTCGALQGFMHSVPVPRENPFKGEATVQGWQERLEKDLRALLAGRVVEEHEAQRALDLAVPCAPRRAAIGFVHRDFCAENLVLTPAGDVCVVDNEALAIDVCDYDLGRTWYRWPMTRAQRESYLDGYERHRSAHDFLAHFPFWAVVAVTGAAAFRVEKQADGAAVPVSRLRALLRDLERRASADGAIFQS